MNSHMLESLFDRLDQAIYTTVHDYPGGATAMAPRIGVGVGTLQNKANPNMEHQLNLREAIAIQQLTGNYSILHALAEQLGHCAYQLCQFEDVSDVELLDLYASYHAQIGELAEVIRSSLADGRISKRELETIRSVGDGTIRAQLELISRLEAISER